MGTALVLASLCFFEHLLCDEDYWSINHFAVEGHRAALRRFGRGDDAAGPGYFRRRRRERFVHGSDLFRVNA
jgi:hypothetical protein